MAELPSGTVTFLFTDIEGNTARWEGKPEAMRVALARDDALAALADAQPTSEGTIDAARSSEGPSGLQQLFVPRGVLAFDAALVAFAVSTRRRPWQDVDL